MHIVGHGYNITVSGAQERESSDAILTIPNDELEKWYRLWYNTYIVIVAQVNK